MTYDLCGFTYDLGGGGFCFVALWFDLGTAQTSGALGFLVSPFRVVAVLFFERKSMELSSS